jgi:hypothetical protein
LPISGELRKDGDAFKVVFSASLSAGRRRFTIAHELAHAIFETTGPNCPRYGRELERMCDMLAGEILLPRKIFSDHVGSVIQSASIYQLARDFDTSLMATSLRCCQLFGVSIFQVEKGRIAWGYGIIRNHRDVQLGGDVFEAAIIQSMEGAKGRVPVFIRGYEHILEWTPVPRQHRALFVLQPANRNNFQKMP